MKTNLTITDTKTDIASFTPVEGTFDLNKTSLEMEEITVQEIEDAIGAELSDKHGFPIKAEIFRDDCRAVGDYIPSTGIFLATRKTSSEIRQ